MMLILACAKQAIRADRAVRTAVGVAQPSRPARVGQAPPHYRLRAQRTPAGRNGRRFRMDICAYDPLLVERGWPEGPVSPIASLVDGLAWANVASCTCRSQAGPCGAEEFPASNPAMSLNTARGGIVDRRRWRRRCLGRSPRRASTSSIRTARKDHPLLAFDQGVPRRIWPG